jgi:hypothetical protein
LKQTTKAIASAASASGAMRYCSQVSRQRKEPSSPILLQAARLRRNGDTWLFAMLATECVIFFLMVNWVTVDA